MERILVLASETACLFCYSLRCLLMVSTSEMSWHSPPGRCCVCGGPAALC